MTLNSHQWEKSVITRLLDTNGRLKNEAAMHKRIPKWLWWLLVVSQINSGIVIAFCMGSKCEHWNSSLFAVTKYVGVLKKRICNVMYLYVKIR